MHFLAIIKVNIAFVVLLGSESVWNHTSFLEKHVSFFRAEVGVKEIG
jgi:hypothetical protein